MKKRMLAVMLPVAAFVALAGTGFGVWVFQNANAVKASASYNVANAVALNGMTVKSTGTVVLDQSAIINSVSLAVGVDYEEIKGNFGTADGNTYTYDSNDAANTAIKVEYKVEVAISAGLAEYIKCDTIGGEAAGTTMTFASVTADTTDTTDQDLAVVFSWNVGKKPTTLAEFTTMNDKCAHETIVFTVTPTSADLA